MGSPPPSLPQAAQPWGKRQPRRWQEEALPLAMAALEARRRGVISATMGAGKSVLILGIVRSWLQDPERAALGPVVVTTPTVRLVDQLAETLSEGLDVGRFYTHAKEARAPVVVCCNASARALSEALAGRRVGLWVADEAHRTQSDALLEAAEALEPHARLAVTATAFRSDARERITAFDETVYRYTPADALRDGVIVPWRILGWEGPSVPVDDACVAMIRQHLHRGPGLANASTIADAEAFAGRLVKEGIRAAAVHSQLPTATADERIAALKVGGLDLVVHVSMLAEGVDYPWLRWACLRRLTQARVRFVQEVGRVLRAYPGKDEAILLDPNDLFGSFELTADDALGWCEPVNVEPATQEDEEEKEREEDENAPARRAKTRNAVTAWARELVVAMSAEWVDEIKTTNATWKSLPPSPAQMTTLGQAAKRHGKYLPPEHQRVLDAVLGAHVVLSRGVASDLLSVLFALAKHHVSWVPAVEVTTPTAEAIVAAGRELPEDVCWEYAGVTTKTNVVAIVVLRGSRIIAQQTRDKQPHETFWKITAEAERLARTHARGAPVAKGETATRMAFAAANRHHRSRT